MFHVKQRVYAVWLVESQEEKEKQWNYQCMYYGRKPSRYFAVCTHICTGFVGTKIGKKCQTSLKTVFYPCILPKFN